MIPAEFDYAAPESLDEAISLLSQGGEDAKLLAGGHSLIPLMKLRVAFPSLLVDLRKVAPVAAVIVGLLLMLTVGLVWLDITNPIANPFK